MCSSLQWCPTCVMSSYPPGSSNVCSTVCSGWHRRKHQNSASLLHHWPFVRGSHQWPMDSPHKGPTMQKAFPYRDVLMWLFSSDALHNVTHNNDVIMTAMASQVTSLAIVYSTVNSRRRSKKTSKLRVTGLCGGNSPGTGEFPAQRASNAENVSIWRRHHALIWWRGRVSENAGHK